uniref:40S ribosomal protein S15 n=1 Tax=Equus asinus TaxID=9793 RepID=A0A9L0JTB2_EQUAS
FVLFKDLTPGCRAGAGSGPRRGREACRQPVSTCPLQVCLHLGVGGLLQGRGPHRTGSSLPGLGGRGGVSSIFEPLAQHLVREGRPPRPSRLCPCLSFPCPRQRALDVFAFWGVAPSVCRAPRPGRERWLGGARGSPGAHPRLPPRSEQLMQLYSARQRRRLNRGLRRKQHSLLKRLRKAKKEAPPMEKPEVVKTHLRDMIILPEMVGSMVGVYNGKTFNQVEIKPEMIGHYLGEFSITYKPVKHGRPGIGATHSSRFIPLK